MPRRIRLFAVLLAAVLLGLTFGAASCGGEGQPTAKKKVNEAAKKLDPYLPRNGVTTWGNPSAPIVTVPIAGKLTSSSTTFFRPEEEVSVGGGEGPNPLGTSRSVDGLFHPNPPKYRYGFTPGGQYVDFSEMPTFCTTALTKFQRQQTTVALSADAAAEAAQKRAERALADGDEASAQAILEGAIR